MGAGRGTQRVSPWGALFVLLAAAGYAALVLAAAADHQPGIDSHYHFRMGGEIAAGRLAPDMAADLPLTLYADLNVDHYWGFHALLAPFAALDDGVAGMKLATVALFSLVLLSLYLFLAAHGVPYAWAWALAPLLLTTLDWRYLMLRGGQLMVPLSFAVAALALSGWRALPRRFGFVVLGYLGMLSYQGAVVLPVFHAAALAGLALFARDGEARRRWWEPVLTTAGLALGLTLNPYMDGSFATWRFAAYHLGTMGRDSEGLYPRVAEFHGFPPDMLWHHPEWLALLLLTLGAFALLLWRRRRGAEVSRFAAAAAGLALAGLALATLALRATEYAAPLAVALVAAVSPRPTSPTRVRLLVAALVPLLVAALWLRSESLVRVLAGRTTLNTRMYEGAASVLREQRGAPVLNVAEADYNLLLWEEPEVACVQGLSRYFLWPKRQRYEDVQRLRDEDVSEAERLAALDRFVGEGVRLAAAQLARIDGRPTPFARLAAARPEILRPVFVSRLPEGERQAALFTIDAAALAAALGKD